MWRRVITTLSPNSDSPWALASVCLLSVTHPCIHLPALLCSRPITALPRSYERSDSCPPGSSALPSMNSGSCYEQVSLIHALDLPIPPSPTTSQSPNVAFARYPSARRVSRFCGSRFCLTPAGSPIQTGRIEFVILRMDRSPPAAPHPASRRRSCIRFQAGERMPGEDFHLSDHVRFKAHWRRASGPSQLTQSVYLTLKSPVVPLGGRTGLIARPHMDRVVLRRPHQTRAWRSLLRTGDESANGVNGWSCPDLLTWLPRCKSC